MTKQIQIEKDEYWWGGAIADGMSFPLSKETEYVGDFRINESYNQFNGVMLSSKGRYLYSRSGLYINVENGEIRLESESDIEYGENRETLRGAFMAVAKKYYTPSPVSEELAVTAPQYCTWMEMLNKPTQKKIEIYADGIITAGLKPGIMIIDDGWMKDCGNWEFCESFENPKRMIDDLHKKGFKVVMWICPFVSEDSKSIWGQDALIHSADGQVAKREWWNGTSYVLDMTSEVAKKKLDEVLNRLIDEYGIDGFKFDGGDAMYYQADDKYSKKSSPNEQSFLWAQAALKYGYGELRACVGLAGSALTQRLSDKSSSWEGKNGLSSLIPDMIQAGLCGYPYTCPDMIGGGQGAENKAGCADEDFLARSCECATLMPMMQFSRAVWNHSEKTKRIVNDCITVRARYKDLILRKIREASKTCEPVLRCLEYEFPQLGYAEIKDEFMIGSELLVAPVITPKTTKRKVIIPNGNWKGSDGKIYKKGEYDVNCRLEELLCFEKITR